MTVEKIVIILQAQEQEGAWKKGESCHNSGCSRLLEYFPQDPCRQHIQNRSNTCSDVWNAHELRQKRRNDQGKSSGPLKPSQDVSPVIQEKVAALKIIEAELLHMVDSKPRQKRYS